MVIIFPFIVPLFNIIVSEYYVIIIIIITIF